MGASINAKIILPVELTNFQAQSKGADVLLEWQTASETNNLGFEIENSIDGETWNYLEFIRGAGNESIQQSYRYIDEDPENGTNYYRLKQNDFDGIFDYSKVVSVSFRDETKEIKVSPNPIKFGKLTVILPFNLDGGL